MQGGCSCAGLGLELTIAVAFEDVVDRLAATHQVNELLTPEPMPEAQPDRLIATRVIRKEDKTYTYIQN